MRSTPRLSASESASSVSKRVGEDGPGVVVADGLKAVGTGHEVGKSDETRSKDAGDDGAALDPLRLSSEGEGEDSAMVLRGASRMRGSRVGGNARRASRHHG